MDELQDWIGTFLDDQDNHVFSMIAARARRIVFSTKYEFKIRCLSFRVRFVSLQVVPGPDRPPRTEEEEESSPDSNSPT